MTYYNYTWLAEQKVGFGWLDNTHKIKNTISLGFTKNITEYWIQELSNYKVQVGFDRNADQLLEWADGNDLDFLIVVATGTNLSRRHPALQEFPDIIATQGHEITVMGHILDKGDKFYELHHQCFLINMNWWRSAGKPVIGEELPTYEWSTVEPVRSEENWHDGYTPHWVGPGTDTRTYTGRRFGWNIIETALKTGKIYSFNERLRDSKSYLYPEVTKETSFKFPQVFESFQSYTHFIANTEAPPEKILNTRVAGVFCTAGGITPLLTAFRSGLQPGDEVFIGDISPFALAVQRALFETKCDFKNFKQDFYKIFGELNRDLLGPLLKADRNIDKMQEVINNFMKEGLEEFIRDVWPTLRMDYRYLDIFNIDKHEHLFSKFKTESNVVVHLTNMFHYQNTAWIYDAESRYTAERHLLDVLYKLGPDRFFLFQNRPGSSSNWRNITPREIMDHPEIYLEKTEQLKLLPWIKE